MPLTPALKRLRLLLRIWMIAFLSSTVIFLFFGPDMLAIMNEITTNIFPQWNTLPLPQGQFWLALTMSLMITLIFICFWGQKNIHHHLNMVLPLLVSKFVSTLFFFIFFLQTKIGAFFLGMVVDGAIFIITYYFYQSVMKERT